MCYKCKVEGWIDSVKHHFVRRNTRSCLLDQPLYSGFVGNLQIMNISKGFKNKAMSNKKADEFAPFLKSTRMMQSQQKLLSASRLSIAKRAQKLQSIPFVKHHWYKCGKVQSILTNLDGPTCRSRESSSSVLHR